MYEVTTIAGRVFYVHHCWDYNSALRKAADELMEGEEIKMVVAK